MTNYAKFLLILKQSSIVVLFISLSFFTLLVDEVQAQPFAYVTNFGSNDVSVINMTTNEVDATIPVGGTPTAIAITLDGEFAYVVNLTSDFISVIDLATNSVDERVSVPHSSWGIAITPDGSSAYITNFRSATVSVIDIATNTINATIPVGEGPRGIALTSDGAFAYVVNVFSNSVSIINTATSTNETTVDVGNSPREVAITPNGEFAYVTNAFSQDVSVIRLATNTVEATVSIGENVWGVAITPDGAFAYVTHQDGNSVSVINTNTNKVDDTVVVGVPGSGPHGIAITPDGKFAYVANSFSDDVTVIDIATNTIATKITAGFTPWAITFGNDNRPVVDIVSITQNGGVCLEVDASVSDPLNRPLSGEVTVVGVVSGPSTIESLTFTVLNTTCGTPDVFEFFLNGTSLGTFSADPGSCTCAAPEITYTITDPTLLAAWQAGANDFRFVKTEGNTAFSWVKVEIGFGASSAEACIFDFNGGNCDVSNLCSAGLTFGNVDETTTVPEFSTSVQLVLVPYTNSTLPDPFDISNLTLGETFTLDITATTDDGVSASDQEPFVYNGEQLLGISECNTTPPMADAGLDQTVLVGANVQLDGSGSSDEDNDPLTYSWSIVSKPGASTSTLTDATTVNPSFSPDVAGEYVVELIVNDGTVDSDPAQVTITAQTAQQAAQDVIGNIETLLAEALLSEGQGNSLIKKLESAIKKLDKEQEKVALNMLNAFINHVNSMIDEGVLSSADGDPLISAVQDIVDSLSAGLAKGTLVSNNANPDNYALFSNYPNPFNPETRISFTLPEAGFTRIIIYNQLGREVARLVNGYLGAGYHTVTWDASNVASGMYFYRLQAGEFVQTRKMVLLK